MLGIRFHQDARMPRKNVDVVFAMNEQHGNVGRSHCIQRVSLEQIHGAVGVAPEQFWSRVLGFMAQHDGVPAALAATLH